MTYSCPQCGDRVNPDRVALGYKLCLTCGDTAARTERSHWCVAPLHKSNYIFVSDPALLRGINIKGPK